MPAFVLTALRFLTPSQAVLAFLKRWWPAIAILVVIVIAGLAIHRAGVHQAEQKEALQQAIDEKAAAERRLADEIDRQKRSKVVDQAVTQARQDVAKDRVETAKREHVDQVRHDRNVEAIAGAKEDSMVAEGGPLDRMFSGETK